MNPLHRSGETDLASLQMENELLTYEVRHLRARLSGTPVGARAQPVDASMAERDLRALLERLLTSPAGPVFRRYGAIQTLAKRYDVDLA